VGFEQRGAATSTVTFFRMIGGALGVTILGTIMTAQMNEGLKSLSVTLTGISPDKLSMFNNAQSLLKPEIRSQMPPAVLEGVTQVLAKAINGVFAAGVIFVVVGLFFSFFMENKKIEKRDPAGTQPGPSES